MKKEKEYRKEEYVNYLIMIGSWALIVLFCENTLNYFYYDEIHYLAKMFFSFTLCISFLITFILWKKN